MSKYIPTAVSDMLLKVTFIRHGESVDNLRSVWAGRRDSALSNHGKAQAEALGVSLSTTKFTAIHSSPLKRALMTAQALQNAQPDPKPSLMTSLLLQEQHYGLGEGKRYDVIRDSALSLAEHFARGEYPWLQSRTERFPEGESLEDVARRAEDAVEEIVLPYVWNVVKDETEGVHIAIVSHGLFIREAIAALMRKTGHIEGVNPQDYRGLQNTGYIKVTINVDTKSGEQVAESRCTVRVTEHNCSGHLDGLVRQKGGIGSAAYDPNQKDIRDFFKGANANKIKPR
ncbi:phosphoglycerate mutase [Collybia nuda]|uniref:Phosphoglycerate mutase n=1 Tax=Collybia nuda TaxID=64659 RepID=A0A9P5Y612_9AGAR|nr:phosphoglycerate mutase [Collybia nuda]